MKKIFAFIFVLIFNANLYAMDWSVNFSFPQTCINLTCYDKQTKIKIKEDYENQFKKIIDNSNTSDSPTRVRKRKSK